jgi:hypothetical protein
VNAPFAFSLAQSPEAQRAARRNRIRALSGGAFRIIAAELHAAMEVGMTYREAMVDVRQRAKWNPWVREAWIALRLRRMQKAHRERLTGWTDEDSYDKAREGTRGEYDDEDRGGD